MSGHLSMDSVLRNNRNLLQKYKKKSLKQPFKGREGEIALKEISEKDLQLFKTKTPYTFIVMRWIYIQKNLK